MIEIKNLDKSYGVKYLFKDLNMVLPKNLKAGIVGINGSGKTTLLRLLAGEEKPDFGKVNFTLKDVKIGYMKQEIPDNIDLSILDYLKNEIGILQIESKMRALEDQGLSHNQALMEYSVLMEEYENLGGYDFENESERILDGLGLGGISGERKISCLSGGQKSKVLLASALLKGKDILLLDEPTNNLDSKSVDRLRDFINKEKSLVLMISHDRDFLDKTAKKIFEIDPRNSKIIEHTGNYTDYEKFKKEKFDREMQEFETHKEKVENLEKAVIKAKEWTKKGENVKFKKGIDANTVGYFKDVSTRVFGRKVKALESRLDDMGNPEKPIIEKKVRYTLDSPSNFGQIRLEGIEYKYLDSDFVLNISRFEVLKNDRILISGDNGSGKTTLIKILTGEITDFKGEKYVSPSIKIGNFSQEHINLPKEKNALELIMNEGGLNELEANKLLGIFAFPYAQRYEKIALLSPGQRAKLLLTLFKAKEFNTLILDEPTNHLDMEAILVLEEALLDFDGMLIIISHDKRFVEKLQMNRFYSADKGIIKD